MKALGIFFFICVLAAGTFFWFHPGNLFSSHFSSETFDAVFDYSSSFVATEKVGDNQVLIEDPKNDDIVVAAVSIYRIDESYQDLPLDYIVAKYFSSTASNERKAVVGGKSGIWFDIVDSDSRDTGFAFVKADRLIVASTANGFASDRRSSAEMTKIVESLTPTF